MKLQGIVAASYQVGLYKTRADVGKGYRQMAHGGLLGKAFDVMILKAFGGGVGGSGTKSFGSCDGSDAGDSVFLLC